MESRAPQDGSRAGSGKKSLAIPPRASIYLTVKGGKMKKTYVKPRVVGASSVHPC
jgi:hypothetical protein